MYLGCLLLNCSAKSVWKITQKAAWLRLYSVNGLDTLPPTPPPKKKK